MNRLTIRLPLTARRVDLPTFGLLVLVAAQLGHLGEHLVQVAQLYALGVPKGQAHGVIGSLDIEWVHFGWNLMVFSATVALLTRFRSDQWLWIAAAFALWHQVEHTYMIILYVGNGVAGDPGLLARGGAIAGGLPIGRPVLHLLYNVAEIAPLVISLLIHLRHSQGTNGKIQASRTLARPAAATN